MTTFIVASFLCVAAQGMVFLGCVVYLLLGVTWDAIRFVGVKWKSS